MTICAVEECTRNAEKRGWCQMHYKRWRRHGTPDAPGSIEGQPLAFLKEQLASDRDLGPCWIWPYSLKPAGYGQIRHEGTTIYVHRLALVLLGRPVDGVIRHECDNPPCFNPSHLILGTHAENSRDMVVRGRRKASLTHDQVREIRSRPKDKQVDLAREYGVCADTIRRVRNGRTYTHV